MDLIRKIEIIRMALILFLLPPATLICLRLSARTDPASVASTCHPPALAEVERNLTMVAEEGVQGPSGAVPAEGAARLPGSSASALRSSGPLPQPPLRPLLMI